jgi:diguanylate cyclase (GGDEF)-like protein/putative nucleotidyltransferase with HDIG domain
LSRPQITRIASFGRQNIVPSTFELSSIPTISRPDAGAVASSPVGPTSATTSLLHLLELSRIQGNGPSPIVGSDVMFLLLEAIKTRDVHTWRHCLRVAQIATGMADRLGWTDEQSALLETAALLHDVGKIGVPDHVLFKPARFNADEADLMSVHLRIGIDVLQACGVDYSVLEIIGQAREYEDEETPLFRKRALPVNMGARILSVADAFDSLTNNQVYRPARSTEETLRVLEHHAGRQFETNIVRALSNWCGSEQGRRVISGAEQSPWSASTEQTPEVIEKLQRLIHVFSQLYTLEQVYDGFFLVDSDLRYVIWSTGAERLLGHRIADLSGRMWNSAPLGYSDPAAKGVPNSTDSPLQCVLSTRQPHARTLQLRRADGSLMVVETQTLPLVDARGHLQGVLEAFRGPDRSQRAPQGYRDQLRRAACTDPLTGLSNRGELERLLKQTLEDAQGIEWAEPFSVVFLDVDHFKKINDSFGHAAGDAVLQAVAECLRSEAHSSEIVGRYGGEEFIIICPGAVNDFAVRRAERFRQAVARLKVRELQGRRITASFGVSQAEEEDTVHDVIDRADRALYMAKNHGRNQTQSLSRRQVTASRTASQPNAGHFSTTLYACTTLELAGYKLASFLSASGARLLASGERSAKLRLGRGGWFRAHDGDRELPVLIDLEFGATKAVGSDGRLLRNQIAITVRIHAENPFADPTRFEQRSRDVIRMLSAHLVASEDPKG